MYKRCTWENVHANLEFYSHIFLYLFLGKVLFLGYFAERRPRQNDFRFLLSAKCSKTTLTRLVSPSGRFRHLVIFERLPTAHDYPLAGYHIVDITTYTHIKGLGLVSFETETLPLIHDHQQSTSSID